jgi:anti-sigma B factor antagonist
MKAPIMTSFPYLAIITEHDGPRPVLRLQGELDICTKDCLRRAISSALEHHPATLVLDLSALGFMDCSGLSVLVWAHKLLAGQQRQLLITGSQPIVRRLICLMGLDTYLHLTLNGYSPGRFGPRRDGVAQPVCGFEEQAGLGLVAEAEEEQP